MATTPETLKISGVVIDVTQQTTQSGKRLMEIVTETSTSYRGQDYYDYYPVRFWEDRIPNPAPRKGDAVDVEFSIRGSQSQKLGRYFVNLNGVKCVVQKSHNAQDEEDVDADTGADAPADTGPMPF